MRNKKIIIAGGSGFIGEEITKHFSRENQIIILTRQLKNIRNNRNQFNLFHPPDFKNVEFIKWDGVNPGEWTKKLNRTDIIINLTGKTVNCRYTNKNKTEILQSRINSVNAIGRAINQISNPPKLWVNASSATIYRHAPEKPQDEYSGEFGEGFSVEVCKTWENAFFSQATSATRKIALRMAITLGPGGVLIPYFNLLRFGLGGKQGNGNQMYSWIHILDTCHIIEWLNDHPSMEGTYNCCSPNPVTNAEFMKLLRKETGKKIGLPAYEWMLRLGAKLIGTETELVLKSRWVIPQKIVESGFKFRYPKLEEAFTDIISRVPRKQYQLF